MQTCLNNAQFFSPDAPSIRVWHEHDLGLHISKKCRIGFPIFEVNKFEPRVLNSLLSQDVLFVTSQWGKEVIEQNNLNIPTFVVPLGVDTTIFNYRSIPKNDGVCRFLNIGKWEVRKGHHELLEAFNRAFSSTDNVELIMLPISSHTSPQEINDWGRLYKESRLGAQIKIFDRLPLPQLVQLMQTVDCGVFPSHAEGWNLPLLEMMACGKSVIATNYSAHTEFCNDDNCYLIDINSMESAYDGKWFHGFADWAELGEEQIDQCADYMRQVYENRETNTINLAGIETAKRFSWENSCQKIMGALQSLNL